MLAHQHVQAMLLLRELCPQRRQRAARLQLQRLRLGNFALRGEPALEAILDQLQQLRLRAQMGLGDLDAGLRAAHAEVGVGGFRGDGHAGTQPRSLGGLPFRDGRGLALAQAAGEVRFQLAPTPSVCRV